MTVLGPDSPPAGARIVVAMSGGVDSALTAALCREAGYDVVGITLQLYDHGAAVGRAGSCCAGQDVRDARAVADRLGIPHYVLDFEERFRRDVMADFAESYARGETPIPCVRCNQRVKFRDLLDIARDLGAAALATGHYARRSVGPAGAELRVAADPARDQSYFLFATTREQLDFLRFPLGDLPKSDVRRLAADRQLPVAEKADSQDICFVPTGRYSDVVEKLKPGAAEPGEVRHIDGRVLGRHPGVVNFTVGQRRGLGLDHEPGPLFVVGLDAAAARVVVGPQSALARDRIFVRETNWLADLHPGRRVSIKTRSRQPAVAGQLIGQPGGLTELRLETPQLGVAPGQAAVLYDGARVLGGGFIAETALMEAPVPDAVAV